MRFMLELPTTAAELLREQAAAAHRPPKYHAEWLLIQALQAQRDAATEGLRQSTAELAALRERTQNSHRPVDEVSA